MKKDKRKRETAIAWAVVYAYELMAAAIATAVAAAILIPVEAFARGYIATGSELILLPLVYWAAFRHVHNRTCDKLFGKED